MSLVVKDIFSSQYKFTIIRIFLVKARHILDFHEGDYTPSSEDVPKLHKERFLAAREFLYKELKWSADVDIETNLSQERNILWVTFPNKTRYPQSLEDSWRLVGTG